MMRGLTVANLPATTVTVSARLRRTRSGPLTTTAWAWSAGRGVPRLRHGVPGDRGAERPNEGQVPKALAVVQPVPHHEPRRDLERPVLDVPRLLLDPRL